MIEENRKNEILKKLEEIFDGIETSEHIAILEELSQTIRQNGEKENIKDAAKIEQKIKEQLEINNENEREDNE